MALPTTEGARARTRRFADPAAVAGAALVLGGCTAAPREADDPVDLRVAVWSANEAHHEVFNEIADEFIAANPDRVASVTFEAYPLDEYQQALLTQVSG